MNDSQRKAMFAKLTNKGKGFGRRYGWELPNGHFVSLSRSKVFSLPTGAVGLNKMGYNDKQLNLKTGEIESFSTHDKCSWCGESYQKGKFHGCGRITISETKYGKH